MKYYMISDIHGNDYALNKFIKLLNKSNIKIGKDTKVFFLGDYIDRGNNSFKVLKTIYDFQKEYGNENIVVIRGNHEEESGFLFIIKE